MQAKGTFHHEPPLTPYHIDVIYQTSSYNIVKLLENTNVTEQTEHSALDWSWISRTWQSVDQCHASRDWCDRRDICATSCKTIMSEKCNQCEFASSQTGNLRKMWRHTARKRWQKWGKSSFWEFRICISLNVLFFFITNVWLFNFFSDVANKNSTSVSWCLLREVIWGYIWRHTAWKMWYLCEKYHKWKWLYFFDCVVLSQIYRVHWTTPSSWQNNSSLLIVSTLKYCLSSLLCPWTKKSEGGRLSRLSNCQLHNHKKFRC